MVYNAALQSITIGIASNLEDVGARCVYIDRKEGCIIAQGLVTNSPGALGKKLLKQNTPPNKIIEEIKLQDSHYQQRQLLIMNSNGESACFTGSECNKIRAHINEYHICLAGNLLADNQVIRQMLETYKNRADLTQEALVVTLLEEGEKAGGDQRGTMSAALYSLDFSGNRMNSSYSIKSSLSPISGLRKLTSFSGRQAASS